MRSWGCEIEVSAVLQFIESIKCGSGIKKLKNAALEGIRNPLFLGLHETIDRYMKSVLRNSMLLSSFSFF